MEAGRAWTTQPLDEAVCLHGARATWAVCERQAAVRLFLPPDFRFFVARGGCAGSVALGRRSPTFEVCERQAAVPTDRRARACLMLDLPLVLSVDRLKGMADHDPVGDFDSQLLALVVRGSEMNAGPYASAS